MGGDSAHVSRLRLRDRGFTDERTEEMVEADRVARAPRRPRHRLQSVANRRVLPAQGRQTACVAPAPAEGRTQEE